MQNYSAPIPIIQSKCVAPRLLMQHVPRPHLIASIDQGVKRALTLISASAGSGKTTLLTEWAQTTHIPVAWLSLEPADNDLSRFLTYLIVMLHSFNDRIGLQAKVFLDSPTHPRSELQVAEQIASSLISDIVHTISEDRVLIFDDYHVLKNKNINHILFFFVTHLPPTLHILLGTRTPPRFPLARLRVHGQVYEIPADELRFNTAEIRIFTQSMGLELEESALRCLENRTEGWIAGIHLATLSLQSHRDHNSFLHTFRGNHRFLLEYIHEEILAYQPPSLQTFLLHTSILTRLSGPLCNALLDRLDSQSVLEALCQANLFVSALDESGEWYRYHPLFAEGLCHLLRKQKPDIVSELYHRASIWYESHTMPYEACEYALQAKDIKRAVLLIERQISSLIGNAQFSVLRRWLDQLPPDIVENHPLLRVSSDWLFLLDEHSLKKDGLMVTRLYQNLQEHPEDVDSNVRTEAYVYKNFLLSVQALQNNDVESAVTQARHILSAIPEDTPYLHSFATFSLKYAQGIAYLLQRDLLAAEQEMIEANKCADYPLLLMIASSILVQIYEIRGELKKIEQVYFQTLQIFRSNKDAPPELALLIGIWYVYPLIEWNRLDEAEGIVTQLLTLTNPGLIQHCRLIQLNIYQARGEFGNSLALHDKMKREFSQHTTTHSITQHLDFIRIRIALSQNRRHDIRRWLEESIIHYDDPVTETLFTGVSGIARIPEYTTLARVLIALGQEPSQKAYLVQAMILLTNLHTLSEKTNCMRYLIEVLVLKALAFHARKESAMAISTLRQAVVLAKPNGFVRVFANEGQPMAYLLSSLLSQTPPDAAYIHTLLEAIPPEHVQAQQQSVQKTQLVASSRYPEPLSAREREVLLLLATGASNQAIAEQLVIAPNTVKRHVKHILAKLGITNRTQAVTRAYELHLL
jgi:LuxR family transcriptional regulator, maltose regulon positive regulatory protein